MLLLQLHTHYFLLLVADVMQMCGDPTSRPAVCAHMVVWGGICVVVCRSGYSRVSSLGGYYPASCCLYSCFLLLHTHSSLGGGHYLHRDTLPQQSARARGYTPPLLLYHNLWSLSTEFDIFVVVCRSLRRRKGYPSPLYHKINKMSRGDSSLLVVWYPSDV